MSVEPEKNRTEVETMGSPQSDCSRVVAKDISTGSAASKNARSR
jgi:hypothetical protein